jgi:hypothetical protein
MDDAKRRTLFIQTKFTHVSGQDERLPYDEDASVYNQVHQSFESSLEHLGVSYLDSYLLHGPSVGGDKLGPKDYEAWRAMTEIYGDKGTVALGVSNVNKNQLLDLIANGKQRPHYVQNRCVCIVVCIYVCMYACTLCSVFMYVFMYVCMHSIMLVCNGVYVYMYAIYACTWFVHHRQHGRCALLSHAITCVSTRPYILA